jgi:hypothetical protein
LLVLPLSISLGFQTNFLKFIGTSSFKSSLTHNRLFSKNLKSTLVSVEKLTNWKDSPYSSSISAHLLSFVVERKFDDF